MRVMLVAGEISGDQHGAHLLRELRKRVPDLEAFGIGGDELAREGMEITQHASTMAVMGFVEVLRHYSFFKRVFAETLELARERKPDAVILVDYPGFNLRLAAETHRMGIRTIYYICPQVWAWNQKRIPKMAATLDRLLAIFPFEPEVFAKTDLPVDFVGHPLVRETQLALDAPRVELPWGDTPGLALLPGSRSQEVARLLPVLLDCAQQLQGKMPGLTCTIASASAERTRQIEAMVAAHGISADLVSIVEAQTREILRQARAAIVASGTATVETALMGCPMVVAYRVAPLTYLAGRALIRVDHIGMVNIIAGRRLCPEFIQGDAVPERICAAVAPLLKAGPERDAMISGLAEVRTSLGALRPDVRAAEIIASDLLGPQTER